MTELILTLVFALSVFIGFPIWMAHVVDNEKK